MKTFHWFYNLFENIKSLFRRFIVLVPIVIIIILFKYIKNVELTETTMQNIISVSGTLAGFLFTTFSIILSFPDNKPFMQGLKHYGYIKRLFICIFLGLLCFVATILLAIFNVLLNYIMVSFIIGILYTIISSIYLFMISFYVSK